MQTGLKLNSSDFDSLKGGKSQDPFPGGLKGDGVKDKKYTGFEANRDLTFFITH